MNANLYIWTPDENFVEGKRLQPIIAFKSTSLTGGTIYDEFEYFTRRNIYQRLAELGCTNDEMIAGGWL